LKRVFARDQREGVVRVADREMPSDAETVGTRKDLPVKLLHWEPDMVEPGHRLAVQGLAKKPLSDLLVPVRS